QKQYEKASYKYRKALSILEQLMMREKPNDEDWLELNQKKLPLLSNLAQCELFLEDYYQALEHTNEVLQHEPNNVKALFRRAKANMAVWNVDEARKDFARVIELDANLASLVHNHLVELEHKVKEKDMKDAQLLKGK